MPNMSYCRFSNTLEDLRDCRDALYNGDICWKREMKAAKALVAVCRVIAEYTDEEIDEMYAMNAEDDF